MKIVMVILAAAAILTGVAGFALGAASRADDFDRGMKAGVDYEAWFCEHPEFK